MCWFPGSSSLRECVNALIFQGNSPQISPLIPNQRNPLSGGVGSIYSPRFLSSSLSLSLLPLLQRRKSLCSESSLSKLFVCVCLLRHTSLVADQLLVGLAMCSRESHFSAESQTDRLNVKCILMRCSYVWVQNERHHDIFSHGTIIDLLELLSGTQVLTWRGQICRSPPSNPLVWESGTRLHTISTWLQIKHPADRYQTWTAHLLRIGVPQRSRKQQENVPSNEIWNQMRAAVN